MKTPWLNFLTVLIIAQCLNIRTNHFHPVVATARFNALAKPTWYGWPDWLIILIVFVVSVTVLSSFLGKKTK